MIMMLRLPRDPGKSVIPPPLKLLPDRLCPPSSAVTSHYRSQSCSLNAHVTHLFSDQEPNEGKNHI